MRQMHEMIRAVEFRKRAALGSLALLALVLFYWRGPRRAMSDSGDFATVYAASRCWLAQENPYLEANIDRQYTSGHGDPVHAPNPELTGSVYLPSIFPLVASVAWLDWDAAKRVWLIFGVAAFVLSLLCVARSELIPNPETAVGVITVLLLFSATQTGISKGQPGVICISLLVAALYLKPTPHEELWAGLFLGISCCLKPNVAMPFFLFMCWRRQWRALAVAIGVGAVVSAVALKNLLTLPPGWWLAWSDNLKAASAPSGNMNPTIASAGSHWLVNFQTVIGFFTTNQNLCNLLTYALLGALVAAVLLITRFKLDVWQALALLSTLVLLGSYHRYYDVQLLMVCTNAAILLYRKPNLAVWIGSAAAFMLWFPLQALAFGAMMYPKPGAASLLQFLAFRNQPLCLLALALVFARALVRQSTTAPSPPL
jgi:hypothetical protein